jgi:hypothetical protein
MTSDEDYILVPDILPNPPIIKPTVIKRGVAKLLIAAQNNNKAIYALSLQHRIPLQAAAYISRYTLVEIERSSKYTGAR